MGAKNTHETTPMIQQYLKLKAEVEDCLLFYRLGDFYELFFEDAKTASKICDLTLTARHKNTPNPVPMCGVPYHAVASYIKKLGEHGLKIAICDQTEDASASKGLVKREIVRIVTPGMPYDGLEVSSDQNHYLAACTKVNNCWPVGCVDITRGEFWYAFANSLEALKSLLVSLSIKECLFPSTLAHELIPLQKDLEGQGCKLQWCDAAFFDAKEADLRLRDQFQVSSLDAFITSGHEQAKVVCGAVLKYLQLCEPTNTFPHLRSCRYLSLDEHMLMTPEVVRSLELLESPNARDQRQGLVQVIDGSHTPMGKRLLRNRILTPLLDLKKIQERSQFQAAFVQHASSVLQISEGFSGVGDLERLYGKMCLGHASPREVWRFGHGLQTAQQVLRQLSGLKGLNRCIKSHPAIDEVCAKILDTLVDDPPANQKDGGYIREVLSPELTEAVHATEHFKAWKDSYEKELQQSLNIPSLKIKYSRVFGYSIEVTKTHLQKVPEDFTRKQTMANGERFFTEILKTQEEKLLKARERQLRLESEHYSILIQSLASNRQIVEEFLVMLAEVDVVSGLCDIVLRQDWKQAQVDQSQDLHIEEGFHPVVFELLHRQGKVYTPNSINMYGQKTPLWLISGPNMGGKSTLMRQIALTVILAQAGCFVPARSARLGLVDQVFTRIGTADAQTEGKSTFYLEMQDTAHFLMHATPRSLILIDELGRGTSTYDGLSILWAVCEFLLKRVRCRSFCATHFYELIEMKEKYSEVGLWHMGAKDINGEIIFDHKLQLGFSEKSYGIHVAKLAGVLPEVISSAKRVLKKFEAKEDKKQLDLPIA